MNLRLQFVLGRGPFSQAIAWYSGPFSHVDIVGDDGWLTGARSDWIKPLGDGNPIPPGVQCRPPFYEKWKQRVVMTLPVEQPCYDAFWAFVRAQLHLPYDKTAIWGFAAGRDWREPDSWFCSELGAAALEASGACPVLYAPTNKITPSALATILSALGAIIG